jgi:hypothetical protein
MSSVDTVDAIFRHKGLENKLAREGVGNKTYDREFEDKYV